MCELNAGVIALILAFAGAFMSLLLAWYSQNQRLVRTEAKVDVLEQAETECLKRERELNKRVTELERVSDALPRVTKRRKQT